MRILQGTWPFLSFRVANDWGGTVLQTVIDNMEASTWSLLWTILCQGPQTDGALKWKGRLEDRNPASKKIMLLRGWEPGEVIPASLIPGFNVLCKLFEVGNKYKIILADFLTEALLRVEDQRHLIKEDTDVLIKDCLEAFVDYLIIYFDAENQEAMCRAWRDLPTKDISYSSVKGINNKR